MLASEGRASDGARPQDGEARKTIKRTRTDIHFYNLAWFALPLAMSAYRFATKSMSFLIVVPYQCLLSASALSLTFYFTALADETHALYL